MSVPRCCFALIAGVLLADGARAAELHFVMVFGSEEISLRTRHAHTFATFVKATGEGPDLERYDLQAFTISWVPASGQARLLRGRGQPGTNLDLWQTLDWATHEGACISMWGPYQIDAELYCRAEQEFLRLESGQVAYQVLVPARRQGQATNCIHAITDLAGPAGQRIGNTTYGEPASYFTTLVLLPHVLDRHQKHDWLVARLGLTGYAIQPRGLERNPEPGPLRRGLQNVMHVRVRRNARG